MRVISGKHKRCELKGYNIEGIRPTMDMVKESIFAMISPYIKDSICLDLFSGSGQLGIEALSNGAKKVYFVDQMKDAINITKENLIKTNELDNSILINDNYDRTLKRIDTKFDIIFIDPPYGKVKINTVIKNILNKDIIENNGILVCEYENENINEYDDLELIKYRKYGRTYINVYKKR